MRYQCGISGAARGLRAICRDECFLDEDLMIGRTVFFVLALLTPCLAASAYAQDVPGIEICTVEKTMERRTSCLQSNVDFLQKTISKLSLDHQQKLDAANRQIEGLKSALAGLQKIVDDLQAAQKKTAEDLKKKADAPPIKDSTPPAKDAAPAAKDGVK
jgi:TolA-binding protein